MGRHPFEQYRNLSVALRRPLSERQPARHLVLLDWRAGITEVHDARPYRFLLKVRMDLP